MSKTSPTQILLDTAILSRATSRLLEDLGLPASAKQRALNTLAAEICDSPKRNWGYLVNQAGGTYAAPGLSPQQVQSSGAATKRPRRLDITCPAPFGDIRVKVDSMNPALFLVTLPGETSVQYLPFPVVLKQALSLTCESDPTPLVQLWRSLPRDLQASLRDYALDEYEIFKDTSELVDTAIDAISRLPEDIDFDMEMGDDKAPVLEVMKAGCPQHDAVQNRVLDIYLLTFLDNAWESEDRITYDGVSYIYDDIADHMRAPYVNEVKALNARIIAENGHTTLFYRRQRKADMAFEDYDFGANIVEDMSGWEYVNDAREMIRLVFFENRADPDQDSLKGSFTVLFEKNSDEIASVSADIDGYVF